VTGSALRFFAAVSPVSPALVAVLAILASGAAVLETVDAGSSDWVLASLAAVQIFAAATGFDRHATRGYYDPILTSGARIPLALVHFAASVAPGVAAWCFAGFSESFAAGSLGVPAFRAPGWATLLLVSTIPWASSVRASRFAIGALWLLFTASLLVSGVLLQPLVAIRSGPVWAETHPLRAFGVGLAFPMVVPSLSWPPRVLGGFLAVSVLALAIGIELVRRGDFPLSEEGP
jgi:hypothetical protein